MKKILQKNPKDKCGAKNKMRLFFHVMFLVNLSNLFDKNQP